MWGNITGTLSNQTDLQTALNAKFNNPTGTISQYIRGDGTLATFPTLPGGLPIGGTAGQILAKIDATDYNTHWIDNFATQTKNEVKLGQTLAKGTAVYVSSANGTNIIVSAASNASENLSSKTFGLLETGGATNDFVKCVTFGLLAGLDTSAAQAGDPVWLGVNGALLFGVANKPVAPANMVYIGVVTRVQSNNGEIFVNVQNGFEIEELHDVLIQSKANNQGLFYESSTGLWKNKSIATVLGYTPQAQLNGTGFVKASGTTISYDNSTYLTTADAASTYQRLDRMAINLLASDIQYPNNNAVIAALALKANAANPVFTGNMTISGAEPKLFFTDTDNNPDYTVFIDSGVFFIYDQTAGATRFSISSTGNISSGVGKSITAGSFVKESGTAAQFLKADGSIDSSTYVTSTALADYLLITTATSTYQRLDRIASSLFASATNYPNNNAVIAGLALKADAANPVFTGSMNIQGLESRINFYDENNLRKFFIGYSSGQLSIFQDAGSATRFQINSSGNITTGVNNTITSWGFIKSGGTSSQFLMADGSVSTFAGVTGSGTTNYLSKWTSGSGIGNSQIYDNGTNVGIGTTTMYGKLSVSSGSTQGIRIDTNAGSAALSIGGTGQIYVDAPSVVGGRFAIFDNGNTSIGSNTDAGFKFFVNGSAKISTSVVSQDFRYEGTGYITYNTNNVGTNTFIIRNFGTSVLSFNTSNEATFASSIISGASVTIGTGGNYATGSIYSDGSWGMIFRARQASPSNAEYRWARSNDAELMRISPSGGLQIGTTPDAGFRLDVAGTGRFSNSDNADLIRYNASGVNTNFATKIISGANDVLTFRRQHSSAGALDIMSLGYNGYVGIGVTTPGAFLHVKGQFESNYGLILEGTFGNGHSYGWRTNGGNSDVLSLFSVTLNSRLAVFGYSEALIATGGSTRLYVKGTGEVGVGTTSPTDKFVVSDSGANTLHIDVQYSGGASTIYSYNRSSNNYTNLQLQGSNLIFKAGSPEGMRLTSSQNLLVGRTTDSGERIQVTAGNATAIRIDTNANYNAINIGGYGNISVDYPGIGGGRFYLDGGGALTIRQSMTATSFFESSDFRLKTLIESNPIIDGIEKLEAKLYEKDGKIELGYFAQDAEKLMPYAVTKNADGFLNLSYREVHTAKIARLEKRVSELEKQLNLN